LTGAFQPDIATTPSNFTSAPYGGFDSKVFFSHSAASFAFLVGGSLTDNFITVSGLKTFPPIADGGSPSAPTIAKEGFQILFIYA